MKSNEEKRAGVTKLSTPALSSECCRIRVPYSIQELGGSSRDSSRSSELVERPTLVGRRLLHLLLNEAVR